MVVGSAASGWSFSTITCRLECEQRLWIQLAHRPQLRYVPQVVNDDNYDKLWAIPLFWTEQVALLALGCWKYEVWIIAP